MGSLFHKLNRLGRDDTQQKALLRQSLEGIVSPVRLGEIVSGAEPLILEPQARVLTVMFVEIVGFSGASERMTPLEAFRFLRSVTGEIGATIHRHKGVILRAQGHTICCCFGYEFDGKIGSSNHAEQALVCAVQLQKEHLLKALEAGERGHAVFPLRIGINTASLYVGNLGSDVNLNLTAIGHGIQYAKKLESVCENFSIMIGAATWDMVTKREVSDGALERRFVFTKHAHGLLEAYEYDPFADAPQVRGRGEAAFRKFTGVDRKEQRWPLPAGREIKVVCPRASGVLLNFSASGLGIALDQFLARGVEVPVTLSSTDPEFNTRLSSHGLHSFVCEVRWGRPMGDGSNLFCHGVLLKNINGRQREHLVYELRRYLGISVVGIAA